MNSDNQKKKRSRQLKVKDNDTHLIYNSFDYNINNEAN